MTEKKEPAQSQDPGPFRWALFLTFSSPPHSRRPHTHTQAIPANPFMLYLYPQHLGWNSSAVPCSAFRNADLGGRLIQGLETISVTFELEI